MLVGREQLDIPLWAEATLSLGYFGLEGDGGDNAGSVHGLLSEDTGSDRLASVKRSKGGGGFMHHNGARQTV